MGTANGHLLPLDCRPGTSDRIAIKKSVSGVEGISKVYVSYKERIGLVTVDQKVPEEDLLQAIERAGPYSGTIKKTVEVK
jgi:copper chaperone CopZ